MALNVFAPRRPDAALTVWYDGGCPLCLAEIGALRRLAPAGAVMFLDATDPALTCPLDRADLLARFHAAEPGQPPVSGARAFALLYRRIPLLAPLGWLLSAPGLSGVFEQLYRGFLRVRPRLQALARAKSSPSLTEAKPRR